MSNIWRLAVVLFKGNGLGSLGSDSTRRKKRSARGSLILFLVLGIYMVGLMSASSLALFDLLQPAGLQELLVSLYISMGVVLVFLFGILYVISIFYYAGDVEKLLPLPLSADEIIGAKLLVTAAYEWLYLLVLVLPPLIIYGVRSQAAWSYYLLMLLVFILLPVLPLCLASVLTLLIMRFTPLARNRDRFNLVSGLLAMVLALAFVFGSQSLASFSEADLLAIIGSGVGSVARLTASVFPGTAWMVDVLTQTGWSVVLSLVLLVLVSAGALWLTLRLARLLYFKGVIGIQASAAGRHKPEVALVQAGTGGSAFWTYVLKDVRVLVRTPIFFMNNVLMNFLWPAFLIIPLLSGSGESNLEQMLEMARQTLFNREGFAATIAVAVFVALACFISGTNGITSSALSREGRVFYIMKIVPMSYSRQIMAKITVGVLFGLVGTVIPIAILAVVLRPPLWFTLSLLAVWPGAVLLPNLSGIIAELFWPKLNWDNEQKAVKQNLNVVYGMILALLSAGLVVVLPLVLQLAPGPAVLAIVSSAAGLTIGLIFLLRRLAPRCLRAIEP